jgi:putative transcriptional regulator
LVAVAPMLMASYLKRTKNMALGKNRLKEYREKNGFSQEKLSEMCDVSRQTIISIESGRYVPSLELSLKFAKIFRCKIEDLFGL